jgi:predicted O-methyltransferase YrrM
MEGVEQHGDASDPLSARFDAEVVQRGAFTVKWFMPNIRKWEPLLRELDGKPSSILEIGSFEGLSACYFLWRLPLAHVTCIDTFEGSPEDFAYGHSVPNLEEVFDRNVALVDAVRVKKLTGTSGRRLVELAEEGSRFELVYVDGSHHGLDVLVDASLSWRLLRPGGVLIFDDYEWAMLGDDSLLRPGPAIDAFLDLVRDHTRVLLRKGQVIVRRAD